MRKLVLLLLSLVIALTLFSCTENTPSTNVSAGDISTPSTDMSDTSVSNTQLPDAETPDPDYFLGFGSVEEYAEFKKTAYNADADDAEIEEFLKNNGYIYSYYDAGVCSKESMQSRIRLIGDLPIFYLKPESGFDLGFFELDNKGYIHMTFGNGTNSFYVIDYFEKQTPDIGENDKVVSEVKVSGISADLYSITNATGAIKATSCFDTESNSIKVMTSISDPTALTSLMNEYGVITTLNELLGE